MKYLYILIFLLCASVCSAQDQRLFENDWFLQKLTINGSDFEAPSNAEIPFIQLNIFQDDFQTSICEGLMGVELTISNSNINVAYYAVLIDEPCDLEENNTFQSLYYQDFFKIELQDKNFAYVLENDGNFLSLVLTNEDGSKAFYGNEPLAIQAYEKPQFSIYPNPVMDELF